MIRAGGTSDARPVVARLHRRENRARDSKGSVAGMCVICVHNEMKHVLHKSRHFTHTRQPSALCQHLRADNCLASTQHSVCALLEGNLTFLAQGKSNLDLDRTLTPCSDVSLDRVEIVIPATSTTIDTRWRKAERS